jgi:hypothetical protein
VQVIQRTGLLDTTLQVIQRLEPLDINGAGDTEYWIAGYQQWVIQISGTAGY